MKRLAIAAGLAALFGPSQAQALTPPGALEGEHGIRVAEGPPARTARLLTARVPEQAAPALSRFVAEHGPSWRALFDVATHVPARLFGGFISAPGSMASAERAEAFARALLERHAALLAPGSTASDFVLSASDLDGRLRTVAFSQRHRGLQVVGGQLSFRFQNDRLFVIASEATPNITLEPTSASIGAEDAKAKALRWIVRDFGGAPQASAVRGPLVFSVVRASGTIDHHRAFEVIVDSTDPIARFSIYIDAATGLPIARRQTLLFADGTVLINAPERNPTALRRDEPADSIQLVVGTTTVTSSSTGGFSWPGDGPTSVRARASGPAVRVRNAAGAAASVGFTLEPGATFIWDASQDELSDAQVTTYVATARVKTRARQVAPDMAWLEEAQVRATVNMNGACNAFSDGETINFFKAGRGCQNTGRLPDVVYHEFGHAFHAHALIPGAGDFDAALSEGASDYLAATITGDPGMGRGFLLNDSALRDIDPSDKEAAWPRDIASDPHSTGLIIGGALWDLRKTLSDELGAERGVALTDQLWYQMLRRATDIPSSYVEILAADDDDGDLGNGTPHICAIHDAFERHGLADLGGAGPGLGLPRAEGLTVTLPMSSAIVCPSTLVTSAEVTYSLRGDDAWSGTLPLVSAAGALQVTLPDPQRTGAVIRYHVTVTLMSGVTRRFPENPADPDYELFVGEARPLYCTEFENDPAVEGWTHALTAGEAREGADDWQWGAPQGGAGSGDPTAAFSGNYVFGNDLGGGNFNGMYQPGKTNALRSPPIATLDYRRVRLQYRRWLNVEDGAFDRARILANGVEVWSNLATGVAGDAGGTHHQDHEWRFHDVDLSSAVADGQVVVTFELGSDQGFELGGWTLDDFCVVGIPEPRCGDGTMTEGETCDDANAADGDGCSSACAVEAVERCGDGVLQGAEACDDGNLAEGDGCSSACAPEAPAERCGNAVIEGSEVCDDGVLDGTRCQPGCAAAALVDDGCGCTSTRARAGAPAVLLLLLGALTLLRRRR